MGENFLKGIIARSKAAKAANTIAKISTAASAAGKGMQSAYQDGAGYYEGLGYGAVSGGVELGTEMLVGGSFDKVMGKGLLDNIIPVKTGVGRHVASAVGEGVEEAASELLDPLAKTIYKGKDALSEYGEEDFGKGVLNSFVTGAAVSGIYGTAFDAMRGGTKNADIQNVIEDIQEVDNRANNQRLKGITEQQAEKADKQKLSDLKLIEKTLKSVDDTKRAALIEKNGLSGLFEADGTLDADYEAALSTKSPFARNSYSENLRGREKVIEADIAKASAELGADLKVYEGKLTAEEQKAYGQMQKAMRVMNQAADSEVGLVLLESNDAINGNITPDSGRIYIAADTLKSGKWAGTFVHEFTHFAEGTEQHEALRKLLLEDKDISQKAIEAIANSDYGFDIDAMENIGARLKAENAEGMTENLDNTFANDYNEYKRRPFRFIHQNFPSERESRSEAHRLAVWWASDEHTKAHDQCLISMNDRWYIVEKFDDAENGYQVEARITKAEYGKIAREIKEYGHSGQIQRIQERSDWLNRLDQSSGSFARKQSGSSRIATGHGGENTEIQSMDRESFGGRERSESDRNRDHESVSTHLQGNPVSKIERSAYRLYSNELTAHMTEAVLGNEAFIGKIVQRDASIAEKILYKITTLKNTFSRLTDPAAKAEYKKLLQAEQLYIKAIEEKGYQLRDGKIHLANREEEEGESFKHSLKIQYSDGTEEILENARNITKDDVVKYLKQAKSGNIKGYSYIPVRKDTPQVIIDTMAQVNETVENRSLVMRVNKAIQDMSPKQDHTKDKKYGDNVRKHGLAPEVIADIIDRLDDATMAIYQTNRIGKDGKSLPNNVVFFVEYKSNGTEGVAVIEFDSEIDQTAIVKDVGETNYHTVVTVFEPDVERDGLPFDYAEELLSNTNNFEIEIVRGQPERSATQEKHPNTSNEPPSNNSIAQNSEMSTSSGEKSFRSSKKPAKEGYDIKQQEAKNDVKAAEAAIDSAVGEDSNKYAKLNVERAANEFRKMIFDDTDINNTPDFKRLAKDIGNITYNGKLKNTKARRLMANLAAWYGSDAPSAIMAKVRADGMFDESILADMRSIGEESKINDKVWLSQSELVSLEKILKHIRSIFTKQKPRVYKNALEANDAFHKAVEEVKTKILGKGSGGEGNVWDWKRGNFESSAVENGKLFSALFGGLTDCFVNGKLVHKRVREKMREMAEWYSDIGGNQYPIVKVIYDGEGGSSLWSGDHLDYMKEIGDEKMTGKDLTLHEVKNFSKVVSHMKRIVESFDLIYRNHQYQSIAPLAKSYVDIQIANASIPKPITVKSILDGKYMQFFGDPASVMRAADMYDEHGFFTETYYEFRDGCFNMEVAKMEMGEKLKKFHGAHKGFMKSLRDQKIVLKVPEATESLYGIEDGKAGTKEIEITLGDAVSLYMTTQRKQARAGLAKGGFKFKDEKTGYYYGSGPLVNLLDFNDLTDIERVAAVDSVVNELQAELKRQLEGLGEEYMEYVGLVESILEDCRRRKERTDNIRLGSSNVEEGFYFPIRHFNVKETVGNDTLGAELGRIRSFSFNKNTVQGAAGGLLIENVDDVVSRHIAGIAMYEHLSIPIDNFNRIYNFNVSDNNNAPVNLKELNRAKGWANATDYIEKLIKDLEGIRDKDRFLNSILGNLRGKYAKFQLGANVKTWFTQLSSLFASTAILSPDAVLINDIKVDSKELDKYCPMAKLRDYDSAVVKGEGLMDKVDGVSDVLMKPIAMMDRFVVSRLFAACQKQVAKNAGDYVQALEKTREEKRLKIEETVDKAIAQKGVLGEKYNQVRISKVPSDISEMVSAATEGGINLAAKYVAINGSDVYHEYNKHTKIEDEVGRQQIAFTDKEFKEALMAIYEPDIIESVFPTAQNPTQRQSFAIAKKSPNGYYIVVEAVGGNSNPNVTPVMSLQFTEKKWNDMIAKGKSLGEILFENDAKKLNALDVAFNKKNRVIVAQFASKEAIANTPHSPRLNYSISQNHGLSTLSAENISAEEMRRRLSIIGSEENKIAAGKLLGQVIYETQQNALTTEKSAAMRSNDELVKSLVMFSADAMKMVGRVVDGFGKISVLKAKIKRATGTQKAALEAQLKIANKEFRKAVGASMSVAVFTTLLGFIFATLRGRRDKDEEPEETAKNLAVDFAGNLLGGLPLIRDMWDYVHEGYDVNVYLFGQLMDFADGVKGLTTLTTDLMSGKDVDAREVRSKIKSAVFASGQFFGLPYRNMYNMARGGTGLFDFIFGTHGGYKMDAWFYDKNYQSDLNKAIEAGDERLVSTIADLMIGEKVDGVSEGVANELRSLIGKGYSVLPRAVGDSVVYEGEEYTFTLRSRARFEDIMDTANDVISDMLRLNVYKSLSDTAKAKAIKFVYDVYYKLAVDDMVGGSSEDKTVLMAEAIDIEKLAVIIANCRAMEADKDAAGNSISGSKKRKVQAFVESLKLSAAQKYMIMGYLGYRNIYGEDKVRAYINRLKLTKDEKKALLAYSGYAA